MIDGSRKRAVIMPSIYDKVEKRYEDVRHVTDALELYRKSDA